MIQLRNKQIQASLVSRYSPLSFFTAEFLGKGGDVYRQVTQSTTFHRQNCLKQWAMFMVWLFCPCVLAKARQSWVGQKDKVHRKATRSVASRCGWLKRLQRICRMPSSLLRLLLRSRQMGDHEACSVEWLRLFSVALLGACVEGVCRQRIAHSQVVWEVAWEANLAFLSLDF